MPYYRQIDFYIRGERRAKQQMEIAIWIAVQAAMFGLLWWFVSSRRAKAERTIKRRPTERAREENT